MSIAGITSTMPTTQQQNAMAAPQQAQQVQQTQQVQQGQDEQQTQQIQQPQAQQTQQAQPAEGQVQATNYEDGTNVTVDNEPQMTDQANPVPQVPIDPVPDIQAEAAAMTGVGQALNLSF